MLEELNFDVKLLVSVSKLQKFNYQLVGLVGSLSWNFQFYFFPEWVGSAQLKIQLIEPAGAGTVAEVSKMSKIKKNKL